MRRGARGAVRAERHALGRNAVPAENLGEEPGGGEDAIDLQELAPEVLVAVEVRADGHGIEARPGQFAPLEALAAVPAPRRAIAAFPVTPDEAPLVAEEPVVVQRHHPGDAAVAALGNERGGERPQLLE